MLVERWVRNWTTHPHGIVLVGPDAAAAARGDDRSPLRLTGAELLHRSAAAAVRLAASGVRPGDRVLASAPPSVELVVAHVALLRLGAVVVPANTAYTSRELGHIVDVARPVLALLDDASRLPELHSSPVDLSGLPAAGNTEDVRLDGAVASDPALVGFTSGTTGRPKGAVLTHGNLAAGADALVTAWEWGADDRLVVALPLFHMHGLGVALHGTFAAGGCIRIMSRFDPTSLADVIAAEDATMFFGVPTMYARLLETGHLDALRGLRLAVSGSAPLSPELFTAIADGAGAPPVERYGMTETVMLCSNPLHGPRRAGRVGQPLPGVELRLGGDDVVEVRGPNVFSGYLDDPDATAAAFTADGWFRTGDVGELDPADGSLRLVGRATELIITGGYNVYPREVEDVLRTHVQVRDVAVVGRPDPKWGEVVVAFVVPEPGIDPRPELEEVAAALAPFKRPREWYLVDELPRNAMGKIRRDALRSAAGAAAT